MPEHYKIEHVKAWMNTHVEEFVSFVDNRYVVDAYALGIKACIAFYCYEHGSIPPTFFLAAIEVAKDTEKRKNASLPR